MQVGVKFMDVNRINFDLNSKSFKCHYSQILLFENVTGVWSSTGRCLRCQSERVTKDQLLLFRSSSFFISLHWNIALWPNLWFAFFVFLVLTAPPGSLFRLEWYFIILYTTKCRLIIILHNNYKKLSKHSWNKLASGRKILAGFIPHCLICHIHSII